jgi:hypothetical protein
MIAFKKELTGKEVRTSSIRKKIAGLLFDPEQKEGRPAHL